MKRRLSLGISIVGNPQIVFLDEPTTGLDPENKRQIWEILSNCKENKCIILTTHLMEEVEVLSDRIGIIVHGSLKCLGTQNKLKKEYGKGFKLVINLNNLSNDFLKQTNSKFTEEEFAEERSQNLQKFINYLFPGSKMEENYKNTLIFFVRKFLFKINNNKFYDNFYFQYRYQIKSLMQKFYLIIFRTKKRI
jgi:ABC-type multidrug transport system ATPase subunit